jgi:hypothetical protein
MMFFTPLLMLLLLLLGVGAPLVVVGVLGRASTRRRFIEREEVRQEFEAMRAELANLPEMIADLTLEQYGRRERLDREADRRSLSDQRLE